MNGKLFRARCLQCPDRYEDFVWTVGGDTSRRQRASRSNRDIWAASHCEKTGHVRFEIDNVDRYITILSHPGLPQHTDDDLQLVIEDDENYGTIQLGPGEVEG